MSSATASYYAAGCSARVLNSGCYAMSAVVVAGTTEPNIFVSVLSPHPLSVLTKGRERRAQLGKHPWKGSACLKRRCARMKVVAAHCRRRLAAEAPSYPATKEQAGLDPASLCTMFPRESNESPLYRNWHFRPPSSELPPTRPAGRSWPDVVDMAHPLWGEARGGAAALFAGGPKLLSSQAPPHLQTTSFLSDLHAMGWRLLLFLLFLCYVFTTSNMLNKEIKNTLPHIHLHVFSPNILQCFFMIFLTLWEACHFFSFSKIF